MKDCHCRISVRFLNGNLQVDESPLPIFLFFFKIMKYEEKKKMSKSTSVEFLCVVLIFTVIYLTVVFVFKKYHTVIIHVK